MAPGDIVEQPSGLEEYLGRKVVIDTSSSYIVLGILKRVDREYLTLAEADVHDGSGTTTTKDRYVMGAARLGVCVNRGEVKVRTDVIISISPLDDVTTF